MTKLAVHLHLYYIEQLPLVLKYLCALQNTDFDLFITMVEKNATAESKIKSLYPHVKIWQIENRGYDIGPFIDFLHHIDLNNYQYILKVHTKGLHSPNYTLLNGRRFDSALWSKVLWESMLANKERLQENLQILDNNTQYDMLGSKYCLTSSPKDYVNLLPQINDELQTLGLIKPDKLSFIAGSMFLAKASIFKPLLYYSLADFSPTDGSVKEGTLAHVIERICGCLAQKIYPLTYGSYTFGFTYVALKRFLYQKKQTKRGTQVIKICKIPVYSKKLKEA